MNKIFYHSGGMVMAAERAIQMLGKIIPLSKIKIKINGEAEKTADSDKIERRPKPPFL